MVAVDGTEVDLDVMRDPATGEQVEVFDVWRIRTSSRSCRSSTPAPASAAGSSTPSY